MFSLTVISIYWNITFKYWNMTSKYKVVINTFKDKNIYNSVFKKCFWKKHMYCHCLSSFKCSILTHKSSFKINVKSLLAVSFLQNSQRSIPHFQRKSISVLIWNIPHNIVWYRNSAGNRCRRRTGVGAIIYFFIIIFFEPIWR